MSHCICIIDDDDDVREVLSYALEYDGIKVISFSSGVVAERFIKNLDPHDWPSLIIVDYQMPDLNGVDFILGLREKYPRTLGRIPMALSTAYYSKDLQGLLQDVIMLDKPLDLSILTDVARRHLDCGISSSL